MGSFCISCGVSGQVIADGDACLAIPIIQQSTFAPVEMTFEGQSHRLYGVANSTCHSDAHWAPKGGFVTGKYADYGRIDPDDTPTNRRAMVDFFVDLACNAPVVLQGENATHEPPFDLVQFIASKAPVLAARLAVLNHYDQIDLDGLLFDELVAIWEYVWDLTHAHRLFCRNQSGLIRPVQFAAFHRITFDRLVSHASALKGWRDESYALSDFLQRLVDRFAREVAEMGEENASDVRFFLRITLLDKLSMNMSPCAKSLLFPFRTALLDLLDQHFGKTLSFEDYVEAMRPFMDGVYAVNGMGCLNLAFSPIVYAGQDYDNSQGQALAQFISSVSKDIAEARERLR